MIIFFLVTGGLLLFVVGCLVVCVLAEVVFRVFQGR